jgi:steroid delta-isomerase
MIEYEQALRVCETYIQSLVTNDVDAILALYANDAIVEDPVGTESRKGQEALRAFYTGAVTGVVDAVLTGEPRLAGNEVAFPFKVTAGQPGEEVEISIIDIFRFDTEGKVDLMRAFWGANNVGSKS